MKRILLIATVVIASVLAFAVFRASTAFARPFYWYEADIVNTTGSTATDLHVKFWILDDVRYELGWEIKSPGSCSSAYGTQPDENLPGIGNPHLLGGDTGWSAVDVTCTGLSVAPGASLTIKYSWGIAEEDIHTYNINWTSGSVPIPTPDDRAVADHRFDVAAAPLPVPTPGSPVVPWWDHPIKICNDDPLYTLNVAELKAGSSRFPLGGLELESFNLWDFTVNPGVLNPGQCYSNHVSTPGPFLDGVIVASYKVVDNSANTIMQGLLEHSTNGSVGGIAEVADADVAAVAATDSGGSSRAPYLAIAGIAAAVVIVLGAGGWYARRRRRAS